MTMQDIHLQTRNRQYGMPPEISTPETNDAQATTINTLQIPHPSSDHTPHVPKMPRK